MEGILIGDSITKYVSAERLGLRNHVTFSYPGAGTRDIQRHFKRQFGRHCSETLKYVAIHCGTNDLGKSDPDEIVSMMASLFNCIEASVPSSCKLLVGQILPRNDSPFLDHQRRMVNKKLKRITKARKGKIFFFYTEGIFQKSSARRLEMGYCNSHGKEELLAKDGLHLSFGAGVSAFGGCLRRALKAISLVSRETNGPQTRRFVDGPKRPALRCTACNAKGHANRVCASFR